MAAVPVTLDGVAFDLYNRTNARVIFFGTASLTGLGVGGGPMPGGDGPPLGIWGGAPLPVPTPPIYYPPQPPLGIWGGAPIPWPTPPIYYPPQPPLGIWGPNPGFPSHPISGIPGLPGYIPPKPTEPPPDNAAKPPPPEGGWGYHPEYGWGYFPGGGGKPQPPGVGGSPPSPSHPIAEPKR